MVAYGGTRQRVRIGKRIKDMQTDNQKLYSLVRRKATPIHISIGAISSQGADFNVGQSPREYLPTAGGTMMGPIAFFPRLISILDGYFDIGKDTENFTSRVILSPETGTTDNLYTILGAEHAGQLLFIQGIAGNTLTLRDANESGCRYGPAN